MTCTIFTDNQLPWMNKETNNAIVLASHLLLSRNFKDLPFPNRASDTQLDTVRNRLMSIRDAISVLTNTDYLRIDIDKLNQLQKKILVEKHLATTSFIKHTNYRSLLISHDESISIMLNEDDHIRINYLQRGLMLPSMLKIVFDIDDCIEKKYDFAFDDNIGYLTASPTNLGTGLRASILLHLPALTVTDQIGKIINIAPQLGLAFNKLYNNNVPGSLYQITNQISLGLSEKDLTESLTHAVREIISHEQQARKSLLHYAGDRIKDQVWRALGILQYARSLSGRELLSLASSVSFGVDEKIINILPDNILGCLLTVSHANYITNLLGNENSSQREINKKRADITRAIIMKSSSKRE